MILAAMVLAGSWGVLNALGYRFTDLKPIQIDRVPEHALPININQESLVNQERDIETQRTPDQDDESIQSLLDSNQFNRAVQQLDQIYTRLDNSELEQFKYLFHQKATQLRKSGQSQLAAQLLYSYAQSYDDIESWELLSAVAQELEDWEVALIATLRASALENRADFLLEKQQTLVKISRYLRTQLERQGDLVGMLELAQQLHDQHPGFLRFQLDLARAHLKLDQRDKAEPLLQSLVYDPELGSIARQILDQSSPTEESAAPSPKKVSKDIIVPLIRRGDSFFINVSVESRPLRLLLDTGASITALSLEAIQQLGLRPTGRFIQLNTANGVRTAQLFGANNVRIGGLRKRNVIVAEIDMPNSSGIQGLLGTDLLNDIDQRYSYLIDNQHNALIFRRR